MGASDDEVGSHATAVRFGGFRPLLSEQAGSALAASLLVKVEVEFKRFLEYGGIA